MRKTLKTSERYTVHDVKKKLTENFFNNKALFLSKQEFKVEQGITNLNLNLFNDSNSNLTIAILKMSGTLYDSPEKYGGVLNGISLFNTYEKTSLNKIIKKEYKTLSNLVGKKVSSKDYSNCLIAVSYLDLLTKPYVSEVLPSHSLENPKYIKLLKRVLTGVIEIPADPIFIVDALRTGLPVKDLKFLIKNSAPKKHIFSIGEAAYTPIVLTKPNQRLLKENNG